MHDTQDVRKSKELHDKEALIDQMHYSKVPDPYYLMDESTFRYELLRILERIAKALEKPLQIRRIGDY